MRLGRLPGPWAYQAGNFLDAPNRVQLPAPFCRVVAFAAPTWVRLSVTIVLKQYFAGGALLKPRTDQELRQMAEHVVYEIERFQESIRALARLQKTDALWNCALESALLHFRNLRIFFGNKPKGDEVAAQDYVPSWAPSQEPIFYDTRNALNKTLAHLTWDRLKIGRTNWPLGPMAEAIGRLFNDFKKSLTSSQADWFSPNVLAVTRGISNDDGNSTVSWSVCKSLDYA
jgi:hypothetical protein